MRGALLFLLVLSAPAAAEEFKLVLTPEPGQAPPAQVCLASRSRSMRAVRGDADYLQSLSQRAVCEGRTCEAKDDGQTGRCRTCPAERHPDCRALLDLGERAPFEYTVVCARDDTAPRAGGTIYIAVETVEAENPPEFHGLEVSGGRVRWSPVAAISRPSYRVLGGDFESSRLSYPRGATEEPWAEVPVRRRCQCVDARLISGFGTLEEARIDGAPVCHGERNNEGFVAVEVPAITGDRVRELTLSSKLAVLGAAWSDRWPVVPIRPTPHRFGFAWHMPCEWPAETCPTAQIRGAVCQSTRTDDTCQYACDVLADDPVTPPVEVEWSLDEPYLRWRGIVGAVGAQIAGEVPDEQRLVRLDVSAWPRDVPGDRIRGIEVLTPDGRTRTIEINDRTKGEVIIPVAGTHCGTILRTRIIGERSYTPGYAGVERGARLEASAPGATVIPWDAVVSFGGGLAVLAYQGPQGAVQNAPTWLLETTMGIRYRRPGERWFVQVQGVANYFGSWPYTPLSLPGEPVKLRQSSNAAFFAEAHFGLSQVFRTTAGHGFVGVGGGALVPIGEADTDRLESRAGIGSVVLGVEVPMGAGLEDWRFVRMTLRWLYGGGTRQFTSNFDGPLTITREPVHAILLTTAFALRL
ncbi:MAG: hypothetical protein KC620_13175 [Myxococcales bacterium]|nr:hypothetical protein [Myxococcales bacterium]